MKRQIIATADGSVTIFLKDWNEHYHSKHGAIAEAMHVFIETGLVHCIAKGNHNPVRILEIGFGTGLNALLTQQYAAVNNLNIAYTGVEAYPISESEIENINYASCINIPNQEFLRLHQVPWESLQQISQGFALHKQQLDFKLINSSSQFDLIYFDAFGPRVQPELWTLEQFSNMFKALKPGGVLVTYSAKGDVRRAMQAAGFTVERLPGPPGKREMLRASKAQ